MNQGGGKTVGWDMGEEVLCGGQEQDLIKYPQVYIHKIKKKNPKTHLRTKLIILPSGFYIATGSYNIPMAIQMNKKMYTQNPI